ncbi:MAG: tRNA (adenosine(37)-N6)-threonylcarbamoyltransferase complex ATPase subunit type 1 TsaE [Lachnospiraceae bacterium]|nr:tRNA (adenosine(37)-N6)-threonylcarbamoyltransferase complex ATPase subunit type 1 TsaE [Lachnospiraceae bacterium]MCD8249176.1 tRNA (adenosine(37)-N6)-threonylcarbamoyltransferase complex ATPase subunit type 1 TsaE [Lachnospiraceae bacterium]
MAEIFETYGAQETFALGERTGRAVNPGTVIALIGDLGVGKTVFTQGVAAGLGIHGPVNSPTFTIMQVYEEGRLPFYHFDVYRIGDIEEMEEIGYEDCFYGNGVCLVEWADLIEELLPVNVSRVTIDKDLKKGFDYRRISLEGLAI